MSDELLFPGPQTDPAPKRAAETPFAFLNRVGDARLGAPRKVLEEWFAHWPADHRGDLRGRLSSDTGHFFGAFWELYLHELHRRLGFDIERDPAMPEGTRRPDFLIGNDAESFYLEATIVGYASEEAATRKRQEVVVEMIEAASHPDFALRIHALTPGDSQPAKREVVTAVEQWLSTLDWETETERVNEVARGAVGIELGHGWRMRALPYPLPEASRGDPSFPMIATRTTGGGAINEPPSILDDLRAKASRYGQPDRPFVIAALCVRDFATDRDIEQALYGPEVMRIAVGPGGPLLGTDELGREPKGLWQRGGEQQATRVSAVLTAIHLSPWLIATTPLRLWLNPWATRPLIANLPWPTVAGDLGANQLVYADGERGPREVLALAEGWPYSVDGS